MTSHGWEASLDARLYQSDNVAFDLTLSGDYTINEITKLGEDVPPTGNYQLGFPYPTIVTDYWLTSVQQGAGGDGTYDRTTAMCMAGTNHGLVDANGDPGPNIFQGGGDILCSDYNDQGILLGTAYPKYSFSVGPTVTLFQDLQVFALAEGQYGRWIASTDANYACRYYRNCLQSLTRDDPMFLAGTGAYYDDRYNGRFQADFWRLRQLGVRYNLPQNIVSRIGADRASLSVSGSNLFVLWQKTDVDLTGNNIYDPEYTLNNGRTSSLNPGNTGTPSTTALWEMPGIAALNAQVRISF
jgi:hypothetical protein